MINTDFEILRTSYEPLHQCRLPGFFARRKLKIRAGARIRCGCGQLWEWRDQGWTDSWMEWTRIDADGKQIWPEPPPDPVRRRPFEVGDNVRRIKGGDTVGEVVQVYPDRREVKVYWHQGVPWNYSRLAYTSVERVE